MVHIFPMKPTEFKISISVEISDEKNAENYKVATLPKSEYSFQAIKDINSKF